MKLTKEEVTERTYVQGLQQSRTIPMFQEKQDRLKYLNAKEFHNCCSNIHCTGHEGTEEETECPKCGSKLHETI